MKRTSGPLLRVVPWRVMAVFDPLERILSRLEMDGTVEAHGRQVVFKEDSSGYYDLPAAIQGVVEFHRLAEKQYAIPVHVDAMERFANKLEAGSPVFEHDLEAVHSDIASCRGQAMKLRVSQAAAIIRTVQIQAELERKLA